MESHSNILFDEVLIAVVWMACCLILFGVNASLRNAGKEKTATFFLLLNLVVLGIGIFHFFF